MKLIVGLGNPGKKYEQTRHNIGFMLLDSYLKDESWTSKMSGLYIKKNINGESVIFLKPETFMNLSGNSVVQFINYFNINFEDILIIQDDIDLNFETYRLKRNSSAGGHNGMKSIIQQLGTDSILRLKIGVSNEYKNNVVDFVLGKFSKEELSYIDKNMKVYTDIIEMFINEGTEETFKKFSHK